VCRAVSRVGAAGSEYRGGGAGAEYSGGGRAADATTDGPTIWHGRAAFCRGTGVLELDRVDMFKALIVLSRSSGAPKGSPLWSRNVCSAVRVAEEHSSIESATKAPGPPPCKLQPRRRQLPCAPLVLLRARRATRAEQRHCWRERLKGKRRPESGGGPLRRAGELRKLHGRTSGRARGDHGGRRGWRVASARQTKRVDGAE